MKKQIIPSFKGCGFLVDRSVFANSRDCLYAAAFLSIALFAAYMPAVQGYYLHLDDYWGFVYEYKHLRDNNMFNAQANMAGRPLGAYIMSFLQSQVTTINQANLVRGVSIIILSFVSFLFYLWLRANYVKHVFAILISAAVFTLPAFHSGIYCITDAYSIYGLLPAIFAGFLVLKAMTTPFRRTAFFALLFAVILLFISLIIYPFTAMFYWVLMAVLIARQDIPTFMRMKNKVVAMFLIPFIAVIAYFFYFRLTQRMDGTNSVMFDVLHKLKLFFASPLGAALNFWYVPPQPTTQLDIWGIYRTKWIFWLSAGVLLTGSSIALVKDIRVRGEESRGRIMAYAAAKYLLLVCLFPLSMLPYIASTWTALSFRYLVSLSPLVLLSTIWLISRIASVIPENRFRFARDSALTVALVAALFGGIYSTHYYIEHDIVTPQSAELRYFKSVLSRYKPAQIQKVHVITSMRYFPEIEYFGFQTTFSGAWSPALVRAALKELARENSEFAEAVKILDIGKLFEVVTSSDKKSVEEQSVVIDPAAILIDMTKIEFLIDPWIGIQGSNFSMMPSAKASPPLKSDNAGGSGNVYSQDLCTGGIAISGGDYAGFPAPQAFDEDDTSSRWGSQQIGHEIPEKAYIGYDFGAGKAKHIRRIGIRQGGAIDSIKVQRSSDGEVWQNVATLDIVADYNMRFYNLPGSGASRFWRILANADFGGSPSAWTVYGVKMMEEERK